MSEMNSWIQERGSQLEGWCRNEAARTQDTFAISQLAPLFSGRPLLPLTSSAMRPYCLAHLVNDIIINQRRRVIEVGAGISTVVMARLFEDLGVEGRIVSIDHDEGWIEVVQRLLAKEGLERYVRLVHAPLGACEQSMDGCLWYEAASVEKAVEGDGYDLLLVDGPPAWEPGRELSRYPALPSFSQKLGSRASIYLDDINRDGERKIVESWQMDFPISFAIRGGTLGHATLGEAYNAAPAVV